MTQVLAVYSETGGVTKTTTAVSLAMESATAGLSTLLIDLDPRGAATKWVGAEPVEQGLHIGAILGNEDPTGWAEDIAVPTAWSQNLRMIPSSRAVSLREKESADQAEIRLKAALEGTTSDVVVIDCPNRQGGPLILNALTAAHDLIIAAKADEDGLDGIEGATASLARYRNACIKRGIPKESLIQARGIVVGLYEDNITPLDTKRALASIRDLWPDQLIEPPVPRRIIVAESRAGGVYFGATSRTDDGQERFTYPKGEIVARAYRKIAAHVINKYPTEKESTS